MEYFGRNDANIKVIIPDTMIPACISDPQKVRSILPGDFVVTQITESNSQVLKGIPLYHSTITDFSRKQDDLCDQRKCSDF